MARVDAKTKDVEQKAISPTSEELKNFVEGDRKDRESRAIQRIQEVLAEERCMMNPIMVLRAGNIQASIEVSALE